ncbi:MAG: CCA tRNA nucleotidyltransferase [Gemmobacter sp.]|uniref:CCA tRNA nucleotidyltransferase n=1 Tax=Gemmobacter sp. TaxID=1898957 RepID=UPI001A3F6F3D|nr:CCA tRNA nucleotidyltransferase [Gemmobacter sp.]MBL8563493.1 CCA tRNA nucleotidyltransferase [Gemmobacter sp.]
MKVSGSWMAHPATQGVCAALVAAGYRALFVGGCVRNALLNVPVADVDIATDALPETVSTIAENAGYKVLPTGIDHGTVTVVAGGIAHEVTTFRRDVETDGRRAVVAFSTRIEEDAMRRDFTMNALYAEADGTVIDPLGGLPDLLARRLRFVGQAEARIREDYLRILRFFRFHAWYGDASEGIDPEGLAACAALSAGIETLSPERVGAEMRKLLAAPDPGPSLAAMAQAGVLARVLPGAEARAVPVLVHLEAARPPHWLRRLAVLGGEDPTDLWRLSRAESRDFGKVRDALHEDLSPAALGWKLGSLAEHVMLARAAMIGMAPPGGWEQEVARGQSAVFPVTAADLMPGLQGPALGARLKALEAQWLQSNLRATKETLLG